MTHSEAIARGFYDGLGRVGLAPRTRPEWDAAIVTSIAGMLSPRDRVLDAGCGYGGVTVPLARLGFDVAGIDLSPRMIADAETFAAEAGVAVPFLVGSLLDLPFSAGRFDVVLCLWSAFYELLEHDEQRLALCEIRRVSAPGGWALLEGPVFTPATTDQVESGERYGPDRRLSRDLIDGMVNPHFRHDEVSLARLAKSAGIPDFSVYVGDWAGRERQFLRFRA
jgi:SAM-dependent methyltransferase